MHKTALTIVFGQSPLQPRDQRIHLSDLVCLRGAVLLCPARDLTFEIIPAGAIVGVSLGAMLFSRLPDSVLSIALALIILVLVWLPPSKYIRGNNLPFVPIGIAHAFIGTVLGIGGLLQAFIIRTNLSKAAITGT